MIELELLGVFLVCWVLGNWFDWVGIGWWCVRLCAGAGFDSFVFGWNSGYFSLFFLRSGVFFIDFLLLSHLAYYF